MQVRRSCSTGRGATTTGDDVVSHFLVRRQGGAPPTWDATACPMTSRRDRTGTALGRAAAAPLSSPPRSSSVWRQVRHCAGCPVVVLQVLRGVRRTALLDDLPRHRPRRACGRRQGAQGPGQVRRALPPCPGRRPRFAPGRRCALRRHPHPGPPDLAARLRSPAGPGRGTGEGIPITPGDSIASSPVTLAVTPSAAKALGRPKKEYSWAELMASATKSDKVRLGVADPARSATGLLALTGTAASSDEQGGVGTVGLCEGEVQRRRDPPTARTRTTAPSPAAP